MPVLLFLLFAFTSTQVNLIEVRQLYDKAIYNEDAAQNLITKLANSTNNTLVGYKGVANMLMAKHVYLPNKKLSYFKTGKAILQNAITVEPNNAELIYLRFVVQCETPGFLKYNTELSSDKLFLINQLKSITEDDLRKRIKEYLLYSKQVTNKEKLYLQ